MQEHISDSKSIPKTINHHGRYGISLGDNRSHITLYKGVVQKVPNHPLLHHGSFPDARYGTIQMVNWSKTIGGGLVAVEAGMGGLLTLSRSDHWGSVMNGLKLVRGLATAALGAIDPQTTDGKWWADFVDYVCDFCRSLEALIAMRDTGHLPFYRAVAKLFRSLFIWLKKLRELKKRDTTGLPSVDAALHSVEVVLLFIESTLGGGKSDSAAAGNFTTNTTTTATHQNGVDEHSQLFGYLTAASKALRILIKLFWASSDSEAETKKSNGDEAKV